MFYFREKFTSICAKLKDVLHGALLMGWSALGGGVRFRRSVRASLGAEGLEQQAPHCCFTLKTGTNTLVGMLFLYPDSHLSFFGNPLTWGSTNSDILHIFEKLTCCIL